MNKYKCIYPEEILTAEREQIKEVLTSDTDDVEKVSIILGIMTITDKLIADDKEAE